MRAEFLPQMAELNTRYRLDVGEDKGLYDTNMTRVFLADGIPEERSALRILLQDLKMVVVGEAENWLETLAHAPCCKADMILVDWDLLPGGSIQAFEDLRKACPAALSIVLMSHLDARHQAALSAGADAFISKDEMPDRLGDRLRSLAAKFIIK